MDSLITAAARALAAGDPPRRIEAFRQFFGKAEPIGRQVGFCSSDPSGSPSKGMMEIVGITEDVKYVDPREERRPMLPNAAGSISDF